MIERTVLREIFTTRIVERTVGLRGESAYEIAVRLGFVGTEEEWLASLMPFTAADGFVRATISGLDIEIPYFPQTS